MTEAQFDALLDLVKDQVAATQDLVAAVERQADAATSQATALQDLVALLEKRERNAAQG